jgi:hypothetical protein
MPKSLPRLPRPSSLSFPTSVMKKSVGVPPSGPPARGGKSGVDAARATELAAGKMAKQPERGHQADLTVAATARRRMRPERAASRRPDGSWLSRAGCSAAEGRSRTRLGGTTARAGRGAAPTLAWLGTVMWPELRVVGGGVAATDDSGRLQGPGTGFYCT